MGEDFSATPGESTRNYEERERLTLLEAITYYLINLNETRAFLHTYLHTQNVTVPRIRQNLLGFRFWFKQLYDFTMPVVFVNGKEADKKLKNDIEVWFKKDANAISMKEKEKIIEEGITLSLEYQEKLRGCNLMPIQTNTLKPPFDLEVE